MQCLRLALCDPNVRFGSKADICTAKSHVLFTPESGRVQCNSVCPLSANSGHSWPIAHALAKIKPLLRDHRNKAVEHGSAGRQHFSQ